MLHLAALCRRIIIISRVLDFCRRTFGGKAKTAKTVKPHQNAVAGKVQRAPRQAPSANLLPAVQRLSRDQHAISRKDISPNALKVLYRLKDAGFDAYLVGGCIRDLLLGIKPKDFDVVTNAHPEQVKQVFRNCRLIGRRFRLAHVVFGREIIEVATFRGHHSGADDEADTAPKLKTASLSDHGQILRDNVYGTIEEDAERRDFTINALYYSVNDFAVYDFANGTQAIAERKIELIGDPETRYREDPVRILRAIRFAAKLHSHLCPDTGIQHLCHAIWIPEGSGHHVLKSQLQDLFQYFHIVLGTTGTAIVTMINQYCWTVIQFLCPF